MNPVYTVGHSNHSASAFVELLRGVGIEAVADVRSAPYSRYCPQFDREALKDALKNARIQYAWLGKELGARSDDPGCYLYGKVQYERLAETELFQRGLARVMDAAKDRRVAVMCSEKEPLECHRFVLVARRLAAAGVEVRHLHADGQVESHEETLERLMKMHGMEPDLFRSAEQLYEDAYRMQERRIAYDSTVSDKAAEAPAA